MKIEDNIKTGLIEHVLSEIAVSYHNHKKYDDMLKVNCSADAAKILRSVWSDRMEHVEEFILLVMNRANKVLGWVKVGIGGTTGCVVDPKIIFQAGLKANASGLILCHNHPSGNLHPSESDIRLTGKLKKAGQLMDLPVLDHIILTKEAYFSFADEGLL